MTGISGLILAAGAGRRFGRQPKLLASLTSCSGQSRSVLAHVIANAVESGCYHHVFVAVGGIHEPQIKSALQPLPVTILAISGAERGLGVVLRRVLPQLPPPVAIMPGDMPLVRPATHRTVASLGLKLRSKAIIPTYKGQRGHPVFLPAQVLSKLGSVLSGHTGAGRWLSDHPEQAATIAVEDAGILTDIDTVNDWRTLAGTAAKSEQQSHNVRARVNAQHESRNQ